MLLKQHDPRWRELYAGEARLIRSKFGRSLLGLEHVGSTSIIGIMAKPIIDILAGVRNLSICSQFVPCLKEIGYYDLGTGHVTGHHVFGKGLQRSYLLHFVEHGGDAQRRILSFKHALNDNSVLVSEYEALKIQLSRTYQNDRAGYAKAKTEFIDAALRKLDVSM